MTETLLPDIDWRRQFYAARLCAYSALSSAFSVKPSASQLETLTSPLIEDAMLFRASPESEQRIIRLFDSLAEPQIATASGEFSFFFESPGRPPVPLWESYYATGERVLMQKTSMEAHEAYAKQGFRGSRFPHEPEDGIILEISFLAALAKKTLDLCSDEHPEREKDLLNASCEFIHDHVFTWLHEFDRLMGQTSRTIYPALAGIATCFISDDADNLAWLLRMLP